MAKICQNHSRGRSSENSPGQPSNCMRPAFFRFRGCAAALVFFLLYCLAASACHAQGRDVVCREGAGDFEAEFPTGVAVHIGPAHKEDLESRVCSVSLSWGDQKLVVADAAAEADIDAFGVDLGVGVPVAALQIKKSKGDCCMEYRIYSLRSPPELLRTLKGGEIFGAADTDLDGRVEIWTDDAAAVAGFDGLRLSDLDFAPPVVFRIENGKLLDASSEFQPYFDKKIAEVRPRLNPADLADFKTSDGKLAPAAGIPAIRLSRLRRVKVIVLEIAWSYLYSGREQMAWRSLAEMWPAADVDRIQAALLNLRAHGIRSQADGASKPVRAGHEVHAKVFDGTITVASAPGIAPKHLAPKQEITPPKAILMERPPPSTAGEMEQAQVETTLELVIDSAGKVRSVEPLGDAQRADTDLLSSTSNWKFIPAFNAGQPVASRILLGVSLRR